VRFEDASGTNDKRKKGNEGMKTAKRDYMKTMTARVCTASLVPAMLTKVGDVEAVRPRVGVNGRLGVRDDRR
jgi:hypothetical protein